MPQTGNDGQCLNAVITSAFTKQSNEIKKCENIYYVVSLVYIKSKFEGLVENVKE